MRITPLLQSAAVLVLAVVAGLVGTSATWALWNDSAPAESGTVRSSTLRVTVDGADLLVNDSATTVALADPATPLAPSTPVHASLTLRNRSDAGSGLTLRATLGAPSVSSENTALADMVSVRTALMPASGNCADAEFPAGTTSGSTSAEVPQGTSQQFCLRLSLPADAPETITRSTATVTVPVHVEQTR